MKEKIRKINLEKVAVYVSLLGFISVLWTSQKEIVFRLSDMQERIAKLEVKVKYLEKIGGK